MLLLRASHLRVYRLAAANSHFLHQARRLACTEAPSKAELSRKAALQRLAARRSEREQRAPAAGDALSNIQNNGALEKARTRPVDLSTKTSSQQDLTSETSLARTDRKELTLSAPAVVVTREFEWGNIVFGFEQANRYTMRAVPGGEVVGYIAEESTFGGIVTRNVLRTRRPFRATVLDVNGEPVFRLRRPMYLVSTQIFVEDCVTGETIGSVEMSWHLWRRRYGLYVRKTQFAEIDGGFLAIDFDIREESGKRIASVNKDFTGLARELFTDARQYVVRLDPSYAVSAEGLVNDAATVAAGTASTAEDAQAPRLTMDQRAVILSAAISIDFDYFSLHSRPGVGAGGMFMPMPFPGGGASEGGASDGDASDEPPVGDAGAGGADIGGAGGIGGPDFGASSSSGVGGPGQSGTSGSSFEEPPLPDGAAGGQDSQWATFEEPDLGFPNDPSAAGDSDPWGTDNSGGGSGFSDSAGSDTGLDADDGEGGIAGILSSIFDLFSDDE